jgi:3-oxoacyl-[acyl-carrier protein] reductase
MDLKLKDRVVIVTASGQGIGAATAEAFLNEGAKVFLNDIEEQRVKVFAKRLQKKFGRSVDYFVGDITNPKVVAEMKKKLFARWKHLDVLVNNLGSGRPLNTNKLEISEWQRFMNLNVYGGLNVLNTFLPVMKKRKKGSIVMIASITGIQRSTAPYGYSAAKASVISLVKNLSAELAGFQIRVNAVAPGNVYFKNGRWQEIISENPKVISNYIKKDIPLKRFAKPEEIASAVVFLASPISSFTTGACLVVDGGETKNY